MKEVILLGDIRKGRELGYARKTNNYIWHACIDCGKERWTPLVKGVVKCPRCQSCSVKYFYKIHIGELNQNWQGGEVLSSKGYREIWIHPDDFFFPMATKSGRVLEHRLVMAQSLGRCLHPWEIVHHRNGVRTDNRLENLQLVLKGRHNGSVRCPFCLKEFGLI